MFTILGYVYDFNVDYNAIVIADILDTHKYLMKKMEQYNNVQICKANICFSNYFLGCNVLGVDLLNTVLLKAAPKCISMNN